MPIEVLLIEDNPGEVRLMREILLGQNNSVHLLVASDGVEALEMLNKGGKYVHAPSPDIILLDLSLPRMDGHEVLARIKLDSTLRAIPVIVLTGAASAADTLKSYQLRASCVLCKPNGLSEFEKLMKSINDFWLTHARLPKAFAARA